MADDEKAITVIPDGVQLGSIQVADPAQFFYRAKIVADSLVSLVNEKKLFSIISGRRYLQVAGWTYAGAMMGVMAREVSAVEKDNGDVEATVELIRASDGAVIGRGSAIVGMDEVDRNGNPTWAARPRYARRSMAITRAEGKAFRLAFPWLVALAGYEATPAEEMDGLNIVEAKVTEISPSFTRPYTAEQAKERIAQRAKAKEGKSFTDAQDKLIQMMMGAIAPDEKKRHTIEKYLTGYVSLKEMPANVKAALLDWTDPVQSGNERFPSDNAMKEAQSVWTAANLEAGQGELLGTK